MAAKLLDPSSGAYQVVAGIIEATHRRIGAKSSRWNGDINRLAAFGRKRSESDLDGTIHLHPRTVINRLTRAQAGEGAGWLYPTAARDAAYNVIYEALRQTSSPTSRTLRGPGTPIYSVLDNPTIRLDEALCEQRAYEITKAVLSDNGLAHLYSEDAPETAQLAGHGLAAGWIGFRLNGMSSTTLTSAARGFVDGLDAATAIGRDKVFDSLIRAKKSERWVAAFLTVADRHHPDLLSELPAKQRSSIFAEVNQQVCGEWKRVQSNRLLLVGTIPAAEQRGYAIGRDTADTIVRVAHDLPELVQRKFGPTQQALRADEPARTAPEDPAPIQQPPTSEQPAETAQQDQPAAPEGQGRGNVGDAGREMSPSEVLGPQAPFTAVKPPSSAPVTDSGTPGQTAGPEKQAEK
jgi:hypothetical protein